jgi:hypothetical protein
MMVAIPLGQLGHGLREFLGFHGFHPLSVAEKPNRQKSTVAVAQDCFVRPNGFGGSHNQ